MKKVLFLLVCAIIVVAACFYYSQTTDSKPSETAKSVSNSGPMTVPVTVEATFKE